MLAGLSVKK
ncbi:hypothetical protein YPPY89_2249, partial [Yersinia pestis PY-89]